MLFVYASADSVWSTSEDQKREDEFEDSALRILLTFASVTDVVGATKEGEKFNDKFTILTDITNVMDRQA